MRRRLGAVARQLGAAPTAAAESETDQLPVFSLAEVAEHRTRRSAWVALHGEVFDFTSFLDAHPGGARGLLRHAGTDASDAFTELHSQSIFAAFAPQHRIGRLAAAEAGPGLPSAWDGVDASSRFWEGLAEDEPLVPDAEVLKSPFPHGRFTATGLETFRFQWAVADRLLRIDDASGAAVPPADSRTVNHMIRQKSSLGVLNIERDWLHVSDEPTYAFEMNMRRTLLLEHADEVYVTDPAAVAAEAEVLAMAIEFLLEHFPSRFAMSHEDGLAIRTTSEGYEHSFELASWSHQPLKLLGLLVQEDCYLLEEQELPGAPADLPPLPQLKGKKSAPFTDYEYSDHLEEHPGGKQHIFLSAVSTFSFEAPTRHRRSMASIHNPNVDRWYFHLQRGMNRLFTEMTPEVSWYRHNYGFHDSGFSGVLAHGFDWAVHVVPGLKEEREAKAKAREEAEAAAAAAEAAGGAAGAGAAQGEEGGRVENETQRKQVQGLWGRVAEGGDDYIRDNGADNNDGRFFNLWKHHHHLPRQARVKQKGKPNLRNAGVLFCFAVHHRIEFQTLRRLPQSNFIFFTVRTICDPMSTVEKYPGAAAALAAHIRRKNSKKNVVAAAADEEEQVHGASTSLPLDSAAALLPYLDRVSERAGLRPGIVPGLQQT
jgi:cytochrome b involved in lipid metabolism